MRNNQVRISVYANNQYASVVNSKLRVGDDKLWSSTLWSTFKVHSSRPHMHVNFAYVSKGKKLFAIS